eukprot:gene16956-16776_t
MEGDVAGRIVTVLSYGGPILTGMTLGVIFREPVLVLLGIVVAVSVAIGRRIAASRAQSRIKGGRFENGRWIDLPPEPPFRIGVTGEPSLELIAVTAALAVAEEVAPKETMSKTNRNAFLPIGMGLGLALGTALGVATDNLALGLGLGVALGAAFGVGMM